MKLIPVSLCGLLIALFIVDVAPANAVSITYNDWSCVDGTGDVGVPLFRVTETYTSAAENDGVNHRYEYKVDNLTTDLTALLLRIGNPDNIDRTGISSPSDWSERVGAQNFLWETVQLDKGIAPGASLDGFELLTQTPIPSLLFSDYLPRATGWIFGRDAQGQRFSVFGEISRTNFVDPVVTPEPASMLLLSSGLSGLAMFRRRKKKADISTL